MKSGTPPTLLLIVAASMLPVLAEEPAYVPIAWYANTNDANTKEGKRAAAILRDHKIETVSVGSASCTLSVPAGKSEEARSLLAKAIQDDDLHINLLKADAKENQPDQDKILSDKVAEILKETIALKAGSKRIDLDPHFTTEGGISTASQRTYVSKRCPYIKIQVRFQPVNARKESPEDTILEVSKPFLEYAVID
ncbi:MAG: hypothetical protein QM755_02880 [Luteolibacter sp.]